jgi:hypothetical protein
VYVCSQEKDEMMFASKIEAKEAVEALRAKDDNDALIMSIVFLDAAEESMTDEDYIEFVTDMLAI